jgi:RNA polymerase sigma-70 factor (ECF subfamily)
MATTVDAAERAGALFDAHAPRVLATCRALLRDAHEAEDAAQQAFLSAYRALLSGTAPRDPAAWLVAIARNECRARLRGRRPDVPLDEVPARTQPDDTVDAAHRRAEIGKLRSALSELPARQREALVLREVHGLRYDEMADVLEISPPSVEPLLWRARRRLTSNVKLVPQLTPLRDLLARMGDAASLAAGAKAAAAAIAALVLATGGDSPLERLDSDRRGSNSGPGSLNSGPGSLNSGPGSVNSGPGSLNSGPGSVNSGSGSVNNGPGSSGSGHGGRSGSSG